jgi:putative tryptophan/tyrosine transport system substrate-binding protein
MTRGTSALLVILALTLPLTPLGAETPLSGKVPHIGFLLFSKLEAPHTQAFVESFRQGLRAQGWVEGHNVAIEWRFAEGQVERIPTLAADLVQLPVDVLVTAGPTSRPAQQATRTIPIVVAVVTDPVGSGRVANLARPGGNLTGVSIGAAELVGKRLELLRQAVSQASRVAVLWHAANPDKALEWQGTQQAAQALGVTLQSVEVRQADDFDGALAMLARERPDGLITLVDALTLAHHRRIVAFATQHRLAMIAEVKTFAEAGALITYGPSLPDLYRRAATYVDKILKGANPAELPVEQPMTFELVMNLKTAQGLGITIPPSLLFQADAVLP